MELSTPRGALFCFFFWRNGDTVQCLWPVATMQRCIPCVLGPRKLFGDEKPNRFVVLVLSSFPLHFFPLYLFCFGQNGVAFFLLLLFAVILAVFVWPWQSVFVYHDAIVCVFSGCKHNNLVLTFCRVCFLACVNFFCGISIVSMSCCFAVLFLAVLFRSFSGFFCPFRLPRLVAF